MITVGMLDCFVDEGPRRSLLVQNLVIRVCVAMYCSVHVRVRLATACSTDIDDRLIFPSWLHL